jgi:hypothetical protein
MRIAIEATISAVLAFLISLIVFGPLIGRLDVGWSGGDMLSTYVNSHVWNGFSYTVTTQFGFPLGMNLNYFPGIDITENTFALIVNTLTGSTFLGINLLVVLSFPLVAALAYLVIRMTGLQGPLAIAFAVTFTFIPFHWGRALGHTYLSTLYSAVVGLALVLLIGSGLFQQLRTSPRRAQRIAFAAAIAVMVLVVAWTGVYYVAFTLILGGAALLWRWGQRQSWRILAIESVPFVGIVVLAAIGFLPSLLTLRHDPPLASLGERLPYESVIFAGNLAMALLPLPQSSLPGMGAYNHKIVDAIAAAPWGESTAITNHGTWITSAALVILCVALLLRLRRKEAAATSNRVGLGLVSYLIVVTLLFFVPWGLNYLFAGSVTAQIRGWNRLLPILLLLFLLGAAAALRQTRVARSLAFAVPIAALILGLTAVDSVYPFRSSFVDSVASSGATTDAARVYAQQVNAALPADCGVLQLPYMGYPEYGIVRGVNDYEHFWTSLTNPGKSWSYGAVKNTDASIWAAQLPQVPSAAQVELLRQSGFCAIHLDTRGYLHEVLGPVVDDLTARYGAPVATGLDSSWLLFDLGGTLAPTPQSGVFLHQPLITPDPVTVGFAGTVLDKQWVWTTDRHATFALKPTSPDFPVTMVSGAIGAPSCGVLPVTVTLTAGDQKQSVNVIGKTDKPAEFTLTLPRPSNEPAQLSVDAPGEGCPVDRSKDHQFAQVVNLTAR